MDSTVLTLLISAGVAAGAQVLKGNMRIAATSLRYVLPLLAGGTALLVSLKGDADTTKVLVNVLVGALLPAGVHGVALQGGSLPGRVLKAVGESMFKGQ